MDSPCNHNFQSIEEKFMLQVRSHYRKFLEIWQQCGLDKECISLRSNELWGHLQSLLEQMFEEDFTSYQKVQKRIRSLTTAIEELAKALQVGVDSVDAPLFKKEKAMQEVLQRLIQLKKDRLEIFSKLEKEESECKRVMLMGISGSNRGTKLPSELDVQQLQQRVDDLKAERQRRIVKLGAARQELMDVFETTEWVPETAFEKFLISKKWEETLLSSETMDLIEKAVSRAKLWKEELEGRRQGLEQKLQRLWSSLKIEKKAKFDKDCRLQTLKLMEAEVQKLEQLRRQRLRPLFKELRQELEDLWHKCHVSESEKQQLKMDSFSEITGETVDLHEDEVAKWRRHYSQIKPILEKVEKRQNLWNKMIAFETNASNPDRFKNRGGNLLVEEKERKKLQKELPSLENEIFKDIEKYESMGNRPFLYYGEDYRVFVSNQWAQRLNQRESKKLERRKQRSLESTAVSTPSRQLLRSTRSTPKKVSKCNNVLTPSRTPLGNGTPNVVKVPFIGRLFAKSTEKKRPARSLNGTTYTDFVENLNCQDRSNFHSSVLERSSKRGKNLKGNKSKKGVRKSARNTTKLTPKRGKLGLPFLI